ncbi:hypothetical protein ACU8LZ_12610 [Rhizobium leguminosarum]
MPGSAGNPVVLDPFRTIIEVGWDNVTHVAFYIEASPGFEDDSSQAYPPIPEDLPIIPDGDWDTTWSQVHNNIGTLTQSVGYIGSGGPHAPSVYRTNAGWQAVDASDIPIDGGLPAFSQSETYGVLDHFWNVFFGNLYDDFWKTTAGGSGGGLTVPGEPGIAFDSDTSPHAYLNHNALYSEAPYWAMGPGSAIAFGAYSAAQETVIIDKAYPAGDILLRYKTRAFRACATAFHDPGGSLAKRLWILFQRSPSDD